MMMVGSMAASAAGSIMGGMGQQQQYEAQAASKQYQAQVARYNAEIAEQSAKWAEDRGEVLKTTQGLKTRATVGAQVASQAASGIDVGGETAGKVRSATTTLGMLDELTIGSNAAREAYGLRTTEWSEEQKAKLLDAEAASAKKAGETALETSLLSGASSILARGATWGMQGAGGGRTLGGNPTALGTGAYADLG